MRRIRATRLAAQDGLTLIEVMIGMAVTILIVAAVAIGMVVNNGSALGVQRQAQVLAILQSRIEYVHQLLIETYASKGFAAISLSANPAKPSHSTLPSNPSDPNDFILGWEAGYNTASGGGEEFRIEKNYNHTSEGTIQPGESGHERLQVDTTNGKVTPVVYLDMSTGTVYTSEASLPAGHLFATVNTYVTLTEAVTPTSSTSCPSTSGTGSNASDARRVIVAARLSSPGSRPEAGSLTPQYATTLLTNPIPSNQCQAASGLHIEFGVS